MSEVASRGATFRGWFGWVWTLGWCAAVLYGDVALGRGIAQQCWTYTYWATTGTITRSGLSTARSEDGPTHALEVEFRYTVDGIPLNGNKYRYGMIHTGDRTWKAIQAELPAGKEVPVYYVPSNPSEAVLVRGPMGIDLFILWFFVPFNIIGIGCFVFLLRPERPPFVPDDPRVIVRTATGWQFCPMGRDRWLVFFGVKLVIFFLGAFVFAFTSGFNPPLELISGAWCGAIVVSALAAQRVSGRAALEFDSDQRTLSLPRVGMTIPLDVVKGFTVETEEKVDSEGHRTTLYHVAVHHGDDRRTERFCSWSKRETASTVANWLDAAVRIPFRSP